MVCGRRGGDLQRRCNLWIFCGVGVRAVEEIDPPLPPIDHRQHVPDVRIVKEFLHLVGQELRAFPLVRLPILETPH